VKEVTNPKICVVGKTGAGKSTLLNNMFRFDIKAKTAVGQPCTRETKLYKHPNYPLEIYDTQGAELNDPEFGKRTLKWMQKMMSMIKIADQLHCVWWVINATGKRVEVQELKLMQMIKKILPSLIVVFTHADLSTEGDMSILQKSVQSVLDVPVFFVGNYTSEAALKNCRRAVVGEVPPKCGLSTCLDVSDFSFSTKSQMWTCGACKTQFRYPVRTSQYDELEKKTREFLPEVVLAAWDRAQQVNKVTKVQRSIAVVVGAIASAAAIGASPVPFSDAPLLVGLQTALFSSLALIWRLGNLKANALLTASTVPIMSMVTIGGTTIANLLKLIPGVGTIAGGLINAGVASTLTAGIGVVYTAAFCYAWERQHERGVLFDLEVDELVQIFNMFIKPKTISTVMQELYQKQGDVSAKLHQAVNAMLEEKR
jgi:uncharacterized protein (DUF697 family)/GTP-binding protein EngB required for normal cell division